MSRSEADDDDEDVPSPRTTTVLFGHAQAERALLDAYRSARMSHAWLIGGPPGIGKATLAYRMARFVLAHPDPAAAQVRDAQSLDVPADHPVARRIAAQGQGDLLIIERVINEKTGKLFQDIRVDDVRRTVAFFGSTAGEGGWRVAIVDSVEELNSNGENALLKVLEEPPRRSLLLLVSQAPGRVLPTIRSRCRLLALRPLSIDDTVQAAAAALGRNAGDKDIHTAAQAAEGRVGRVLDLLDGPGLALRQRVLDLLAQLPSPDRRALHTLGDALAGVEAQPLRAVLDTINAWLAAQLSDPAQDKARNARVASAWQKINAAVQEATEYNLDRRPLVFAVFGWLAEASRG